MSNWLCRLFCVCALTACLPLFAQEFRAGITGIVKDSQGAVVPGVPIEAQNTATNDVFRATTNEAGVYAFPVLAIGTYRLTVSASGFKESRAGQSGTAAWATRCTSNTAAMPRPT